MDAAAEKVAEKAAEIADKLKDAAGKVLGQDPLPPLPESRAELLALHRAARQRRDAAALGSHERVEAAYELERIEVQIARVERAMDPPLV